MKCNSIAVKWRRTLKRKRKRLLARSDRPLSRKNVSQGRRGKSSLRVWG